MGIPDRAAAEIMGNGEAWEGKLITIFKDEISSIRSLNPPNLTPHVVSSDATKGDRKLLSLVR